MENKKFVVVMPGRNCEKWCEKSLLSAAGQQYDNFRVIVVNDTSTDNTGKLLEETILKHNLSNVKLINNTERLGALHNLYNMIHSCDDKEIVCMLDLDDFFAHPNVLTNLNEMYQDENVWVTYGNYLDWPGMTQGCTKPPPFILNGTNSYRRLPWFMSHLRTMYAGLFKKINKEDLLDKNGQFASMAWDLFIMLPISELAGERLKFNPDHNVLYNNQNPLSDHRVNQGLQASLDAYVRNKKPYQKLEKLF